MQFKKTNDGFLVPGKLLYYKVVDVEKMTFFSKRETNRWKFFSVSH